MASPNRNDPNSLLGSGRTITIPNHGGPNSLATAPSDHNATETPSATAPNYTGPFPVLPVSNPIITNGFFSAGTTLSTSTHSGQSNLLGSTAVPHISNQSNSNPFNASPNGIGFTGNFNGPSNMLGLGTATATSGQNNQNTPTLATLNFHRPNNVFGLPTSRQSGSNGSLPSPDLPSDDSSRRYGEIEKRPLAGPHGEVICAVNAKSYEEWKWEKWQLDGNLNLEESPAKFKVQNPLCMLSGDDEMIEVVVGEDASLWVIHKKLLCAQSSFFQAAINSRFREGTERRVVLEEDDNDAFSIFVQWLYSGFFTTISLRILLHAYVLGDKLGASSFQSLAFDKIYSMNVGCCRFTPEQAVWVSANTLPESTLREFAMDTLALSLLNNTLELSREDWDLLTPVHIEILHSIQSIGRFQPKLWQPWSRLHYSPVI